MENSIRDYINIILEILSNAKDKKKHQATDIRKREFKIPLFIIYFLSNLQKNQLRSPSVQILVSKEQCPLKVSELLGEIANSTSGKEIHKVTLGHFVGKARKFSNANEIVKKDIGTNLKMFPQAKVRIYFKHSRE